MKEESNFPPVYLRDLYSNNTALLNRVEFINSLQNQGYIINNSFSFSFELHGTLLTFFLVTVDGLYLVEYSLLGKLKHVYLRESRIIQFLNTLSSTLISLESLHNIETLIDK